MKTFEEMWAELPIEGDQCMEPEAKLMSKFMYTHGFSDAIREILIMCQSGDTLTARDWAVKMANDSADERKRLFEELKAVGMVEAVT